MKTEVRGVRISATQRDDGSYEFEITISGVAGAIPQIGVEDGRVVLKQGAASGGQVQFSAVSDDDDTTAVCPYCGWHDSYPSASRARQGLTAHVRQLHPVEWESTRRK